MPWKRPFLWRNPVQWHVTSGDQSVAATANDESLQVRVRKGTPPRREVNSAPFSTQGCQITNKKGLSSRSVKCCTIAKGDRLRAKARVKQAKLWTILAWYLCLFVQNWKCRTSTKGTKVPGILHCHSLSWERGAEALIPVGSQRCEWREEVGHPTQCLRILLAELRCRFACLSFQPPLAVWFWQV